MVETEMSIQSEPLSKPISSYSKIEVKEDEGNNNLINSEKLIPISTEDNHKFFYKRLGNTYALFGDIYGNPKIIIGPHWPLYFLVVFFVTYGIIFFFNNFGNLIKLYQKIIGIFFYLIFISSYTHCVLINPGYPKNDKDSRTGQPRKKFYFCKICKLWANKEKKTLHCNDCDICVEGNDHHCPWTGKCIGDKNMKSFIIFVVSTFVMIIYFFLVAIYSSFSLKKIKKK